VPPESRKRFKAALALLEASESEALIFTKVDRASRCTEDFARLIRLSEEQDWRLIVTEMGIDSRTQKGKAVAHMAVVFAELERDFIRSRTREALPCAGTTESSSGDRGRRQTTWWPALCASARRARLRTPLPAI
jgi:DNA invertase Pin-like site-specific DNA recombinase